MRTKVEQHIKSQLNERNLTQSESSWDKLSQLLDEDESQPKTTRFPKRGMMAIAASVAVLVGVFFGINYFESNSTVPNSSEIVSTENENINSTEKPNPIVSTELENQPTTEIVDLHATKKSMKKTDFPTSSELQTAENLANTIEVKKEKLTVEEKIIEIEKPKLELKSETVIALNTDSISKPKKKANYVDPEMLLYSIENNQAVKERNAGSRMVIIDFNK